MQIVPHFWFNTNVFTIIFVPDLTSCKLGLPFTSLGSSSHEKTPHCWLKFVYQHLSCNGNIFAIIAWKLAAQCLSVALSVDMWVLYMYLPTRSTDLCTLFTGSNYCFLKASVYVCMSLCTCFKISSCSHSSCAVLFTLWPGLAVLLWLLCGVRAASESQCGHGGYAEKQ